MAIETGFGSTVGGVRHADPPRVLRAVELNDDNFTEKYATDGELTSGGDRTSCWMASIPTWDDDRLKKEVAANEKYGEKTISLYGVIIGSLLLERSCCTSSFSFSLPSPH